MSLGTGNRADRGHMLFERYRPVTGAGCEQRHGSVRWAGYRRLGDRRRRQCRHQAGRSAILNESGDGVGKCCRSGRCRGVAGQLRCRRQQQLLCRRRRGSSLLDHWAEVLHGLHARQLTRIQRDGRVSCRCWTPGQGRHGECSGGEAGGQLGDMQHNVLPVRGSSVRAGRRAAAVRSEPRRSAAPEARARVPRPQVRPPERSAVPA